MRSARSSGRTGASRDTSGCTDGGGSPPSPSPSREGRVYLGGGGGGGVVRAGEGISAHSLRKESAMPLPTLPSKHLPTRSE